MVEIETKGLLALLAAPESLMGVLLLAGALVLFRFTLSEPNLSHIPLSDADLSRAERWNGFVNDPEGVLARGYKKYRTKLFRIDTPEGPKIVLPPEYMDEMKSIDDAKMKMTESLDDETLAYFTGNTNNAPMMNHLVKGDLTASLNRINGRLAKTSEAAIASELPDCPDWTLVPFYMELFRIVAIVSGDVFVGPEMCRNEEYMALSIDYVHTSYAAIIRLRTWWQPLRFIGQYFNPEIRRMKRIRADIKKLLAPLIKERRKLQERGTDLPDDLLQWALKKESKFPSEINGDGDLAVLQLRLSMAAIHTTSMTSEKLIRDVASQPGLSKLLRDEVEEVLARHGGALTTKALYDMKLLDSVMKESQRMHSLGPNGYHNKTRVGITFSDGTYIPPNVNFCMASRAASTDPARWPNGDKFDPYRFVKMRAASDEDAGKYQFVTINKEMVSFGYGKHACPGRFFAVNEIKLIFIFLLKRYDVETREGKVNAMGQPELFFRNAQ